MPSALRSRVALVALLGAFLIPIGLSSLRGLTHVLACEETTPIPFTVVVDGQGRPSILSSLTLERGQVRGVCGGLTLDPQVRPLEAGRIELILPVTNTTDFTWRGSARLRLNDDSFPIRIGTIRSGETRTDRVDLRLQAGTHQLTGALLVGP